MTFYDPPIKILLLSYTCRNVSTSECDGLEHFFDDVSRCRYVGLDTEWGPRDAGSPVVLLQLASATGLCLLVRFPGRCRRRDELETDQCDASTFSIASHWGVLSRAPLDNDPTAQWSSTQLDQRLLTLLSNEEIVKLGLGVDHDAQKLMAARQIQARGLCDLRRLQVAYGKRNKTAGLRDLTSRYLGVELSKDEQLSDWTAPELSASQLLYAAKDAMVSLHLAVAMFHHRQCPFAAPQTDYHSWDLPVLFDDADFAAFLAHATLANPPDLKLHSDRKRQPLGLSQLECGSATTSTAHCPTRSGPVYRTSRLLAPDGGLLSVIDRSKADWYVRRGLAEALETTLGRDYGEEILTIRLNFEPSGRPSTSVDDQFYTREKPNRCVVCGFDEIGRLVRKYIIPHDYRKHFPIAMKDHKSHDVVLLCVACHLRSDAVDNQVRQRLADRCGAPLTNPSRFSTDPELQRVRSAARALLNSRDRIPAQRLFELQRIVAEHTDVDVADLTHQGIVQAATVETLKEKSNSNFTSHGYKVVSSLSSFEDLLNFETLWRQNFLDHMQPKYLPDDWSVNHKHSQCLQYGTD